jgi:predicted aminopeptidase
VLAGALLATPMGCYVSRAAYEEARILARRQDIDQLLLDQGQPRSTGATHAAAVPSSAVLAKLALVRDARAFAIDSLRLAAGASFTQFVQLDRDTLVLVLSAAYRDRLVRKTWWFPVVGAFPYKGFFDFDEAARARTALEREGFDVTLGPSSAFSTLGWFNDPVVSSTIAQDSVTLVNTVLHELTHNTYFARGDVSFNESFASFVGGRGAEEFFRARSDLVRLQRAETDWQDDLTLGAFWERLARTLDSAFATFPDSARAARLAARERIYRDARVTLRDSVAPRLHGFPAGWADRVALNNATLLARRVYSQRLDWFDSLYVVEGRSVARVVARIKREELRPGARR